MKQGCIDVGMIIELIVLFLFKIGDVQVLVDMCIVEGMVKVFGGLYLVFSVYVQCSWFNSYKEEVQKLVCVFVKMFKFINMYIVEQIVEKMFKDYYGSNKVLYIQVLNNLLFMYFLDGKMFKGGLEIVLVVLFGFNFNVKGKYVDLFKIYIDEFVNVVK